MKKLALVLAVCLSSLALCGQHIPQSFTYQAVARHDDGTPITTPVSFRLSIIEGTVTGAIVYTESVTLTPNKFGVVTIPVGEVSPVAFAAINWGADDHFLNVEMDTGSGFEQMGVPEKIRSVPYSLSAKESQTLSLTSDNLSILPGNTVSLSAIASPWLKSGSDIYFSGGKVGVGTPTPTNPFTVEAGEPSSASVIYAKYTGEYEFYNPPAVGGYSKPSEGYGIGGKFEGGNTGVEARAVIDSLGSYEYYGLKAKCNGGYGNNYGVYSEVLNGPEGYKYGVYSKADCPGGFKYGLYAGAFGGGTNFGVYATAGNGSTNWAGYFVGNVFANGRLGIKTPVIDFDLEVNGTAGKPGGGSWDNSSSDIRLKNVIGAYTGGLAAITSLQPILYRYRENNAKQHPSDVTYCGLSAQEVQTVLPEAVSADSEGWLGINFNYIDMALINAVKEQQEQIEALKKENEELKARLEHIEDILWQHN